MERNTDRKTVREEIIDDLRLRLSDLRKTTYPLNPEITILHHALRMEEGVLRAKSNDVSNFFTTGYAGRRVILWDYMDGKWKGQLRNVASDNLKKMSAGDSAEEMLRGLMPSRENPPRN